MLTSVPRTSEYSRQLKAQLCEICTSSKMKNFLRSAKDRFSLAAGSDGIRLGTWDDLQYRGRTCSLCNVVVSLLRERLIKGDMVGSLEVTLGHSHKFNHHNSYYRGYFKVSIRLEISEPGHARVVRLEDAFQISTMLLREPQMNGAFSDPACTRNLRARLRSETCNYDLVRNWLKICHESHGRKCIVLPRQPITTIRLVDVFARSIKPFVRNGDSKLPPYFSLS